MWFKLGFQNFIAKSRFSHESCVIFVSDFVRIWHTTLSNDDLISISKSLNPLLEASVQTLREITLNALEDVKTKKEIKEKNNHITLIIESNSRGVNFRFEATLNEGNNDMFYEEFTVPLLMALLRAQTREIKLIKIIEDKDSEITEYKQEYGHSKSYIKITKPFVKKEFDCSESSANSPVDISSFLDFVSHNILPTVNLSKVEEKQQVQLASQEIKGKYSETQKFNTNLSVFRDKNSIEKIRSKSCVNLDNQIIKKKKLSNISGLKL